MSSRWSAFEAGLDAVAVRGRRLRCWWRDDDAGRHHPALERLLELAEALGVPLALAVVPSWLSPTAQARIAASSQVTVLQHGFAHLNHAADGERSIELGGKRTLAEILEELQEGREILEEAFGAAFRPVLVPPWNRIDPKVLPELASAGYSGLSTWGSVDDGPAAHDITRINTHLDPINWRGDRGFLGEDKMLARLTELMGADEPIGLLSHHLAMDEPSWSFLERLLTTLHRHPAARIQTASRLFERQPRGRRPAGGPGAAGLPGIIKDAG